MTEEQLNDELKLEGIDADGYGKIPKIPMRDKNLSIEAKAIYAYICSYAGGGKNYSFPTVKRMCDDLCISEARLIKHRKMLIDLGYIEVVKMKSDGKNFMRNAYVLKQSISTSVIHTPTIHTPTNHGYINPMAIELMGNENVGTNNNTILNNNININNNITNKKTSRPRYSDDNEHYKMAYYLFEKIRENSPTFKEPNFQAWANDMRLMVERDKRNDKVEIKNLIDFCQSDSFWMSNILSADKFRKRYDQLLIKFNQRGNKRGRKSIQASSQQSKLTPDYGF